MNKEKLIDALLDQYDKAVREKNIEEQLQTLIKIEKIIDEMESNEIKIRILQWDSF